MIITNIKQEHNTRAQQKNTTQEIHQKISSTQNIKQEHNTELKYMKITQDHYT